MKKPKPVTAAEGMSDEDLERMAAEFDQEFVADTFGPVPPEARARLRRAKKKRGRPRSSNSNRSL